MSLSDMLDEKSLKNLQEAKDKLDNPSYVYATYDEMKEGLEADYQRIEKLVDLGDSGNLTAKMVNELYSSLKNKYSNENFQEEFQECLGDIQVSMKTNYDNLMKKVKKPTKKQHRKPIKNNSKKHNKKNETVHSTGQMEYFVSDNTGPFEYNTSSSSDDSFNEDDSPKLNSLEKSVLEEVSKKDSSSVFKKSKSRIIGAIEEDGMNKYTAFVKEIKSISNENFKNKIMYGEAFLDLEKASCEDLEDFSYLRNKVESTWDKIDNVDVLVEEGRKNLVELNRLKKDYEIFALNKENEIVENKGILDSLKKEYNSLKETQEIVGKEPLGLKDKAKNVFYSIFNKKKVFEPSPNPRTVNERLNLETEMFSLKNRIKNQSNVLKRSEKEFNGTLKKIGESEKNIGEIKNFLNNSINIQDFYQEYSDNVIEWLNAA